MKSAFVKFLHLLALLIIFIKFSYSQKMYIEEDKVYENVRIYTKTNRVLKGTNLKLTDNSIIFNTINSHEPKIMSVDDIKYVMSKQGSNSLKYGLIGAGIGCLSGLYTIAELSSDPFITDFNSAGIMIGTSVGGALIGAIIGSFDINWKRFYTSDKTLSINIIPQANFQNNNYSINIYLNF